MNRKELTNTFMIIWNWNKPFGLQALYSINSALCGLRVNVYQSMCRQDSVPVYDSTHRVPSQPQHNPTPHHSADYTTPAHHLDGMMTPAGSQTALHLLTEHALTPQRPCATSHSRLVYCCAMANSSNCVLIQWEITTCLPLYRSDCVWDDGVISSVDY